MGPRLEPSPHHAKAVGLLKGPLPGFGLRGALGVDYVFAIGPADDPGTLCRNHGAQRPTGPVKANKAKVGFLISWHEDILKKDAPLEGNLS